MKKIYRCFSLLLSLVLITLPAGAGQDVIPEYDNFMGEQGFNATQNALENYFYSDLGLSCVAAEKFEDSGEEIYVEGLVEEITFLTDSTDSELFPVWTANGNFIMYMIQSNESGNSESYIMKENGSDIWQIDTWEGKLISFNDMNPKGSELVFTESIDSQTGLYLLNLENGDVSPVADEPDKSESWGSWCRLGRKIIYTQTSGDSPSQLWIVDRDGNNKTRLGTSENVGMGKDWCPLGLKVLYSAKNSKEKPDLWVIDWHGTNQTQLTDTPYGEWNPSFSPDGKRIVYVSDESGKPEIWLRDIEGKYRTRLTDDIGIIDSVPRWSPDGSKIVFTAHNLQNDLNSSTINGSNLALLNGSNDLIISGDSAIMDTYTLLHKSSIRVPTVEDTILRDYSITNSSDSTLKNDFNSSIIYNMDIGVIKLRSAPAGFPIPEVTSVKINSAREISDVRTGNTSVIIENES